MSSGDRVSLPLIGPLIPDGVKPGTLFLVEFDPESQWLAVAATVTAGYLRVGGYVVYVAQLRAPETVGESLLALGVDVSSTIREGRLAMDDFYSATLTGGRLGGGGPATERIEGGTRARSLKVADLSVDLLKEMKQVPESGITFENMPPGALSIWESQSQFLRFNEEKSYVEWAISRLNPNMRRIKRIVFGGIVRGIHTESFYKQLETDDDGVIELRIMERDDKVKNLLRVRSLKGQPHDSSWHEIEIKPNGEAVLST